MDKKSEPVQPVVGSVRMGDQNIALSPIPIPIVYFDAAPSLSHMNGVIGVTLVASGNVPMSEVEGVAQVASVVAHLKCNIPAAESLIGALQSALLLARPVEKSETGKAN